MSAAPFSSSIEELHAAIRAGQTSVSAELDATLAAIDSCDDKLQSFIEIDYDGARTAAKASDRRFAEHSARPLEGVTIAVKSNIAVAGLEWNAGMELRRGIIAEGDAFVVERLRDAGAVILGTLNMHEAALGATTDNVWFGTTINPIGDNRTPGGSSGGSGAAVAAGFCMVALGTDTLGSVRIPAAYCGVYGLKPGNGTLSTDGLVPLARSLDCIGPLARSLDEIERLWAVLGDDGGSTALSRIILLDNLGGVECEPAVLEGYRNALAAVDEYPHTTVHLGDLSAIRTAGLVDSARELTEWLGEDRTCKADQLSKDLCWLLDYADNAEPDPALLRETGAALRAMIGNDGVMLLPTAPQTAFVQGSRAPANQADFTALANIAGLPALTLPSGTDAAGMPVAVQIIGPTGSEALLIDFARALIAHLKPGSSAPA